MRAGTRGLVSVWLTVVLLLAPMTALLPTTGADETVPLSYPGVDMLAAQDAVLRGLDWFADRQTLDGGWSASVGLTGLITLCFTTAGFDHTNRTVARALGYLRNFYNPEEGTVTDAFPNYDTSIALMAMITAGDPQDTGRVLDLADFVEDFQFPANPWYNTTEEWYVGGWPNNAGLPDVSNTQFAVLGLMFADLYSLDYTVPDDLWSRTVGFVRSCQNWPDVNEMPWAHNESLPSYGDGGMVYNAYRSRTPLGEQMFESYGSITAGGLFSYLVAGHDPRNPEVQAARDWLEGEYNLEVNPRMIGKGLYYYLWSQARTVAISTQDWVVDGSGKLHDPRVEAADYFMDRQSTTGGWPGNPEIGWREEEPELAGVYALLTIMAGYMVVPDPQLSIKVEGASKVRFIDGEGRTLRTDTDRGLVVTDDSLQCSDPEVFRKIWVIAEGGNVATLTATGAWGEGRTCRVTRTAGMGGAGRATFHVASGSFAGPFGIHVTAFDDAPRLTVSKNRVELEKGGTKVLAFDLQETTGEGPVSDAKLITLAGSGVVADVDEQGVLVPAGGDGILGLTISVDENPKGSGSWAMVVTSATAPPVRIDVALAGEDQPGITYAYLYSGIIVVLLLLSLVFFLLPRMGRRHTKVVEDEVTGDEGGAE